MKRTKIYTFVLAVFFLAVLIVQMFPAPTAHAASNDSGTYQSNGTVQVKEGGNTVTFTRCQNSNCQYGGDIQVVRPARGAPDYVSSAGTTLWWETSPIKAPTKPLGCFSGTATYGGEGGEQMLYLDPSSGTDGNGNSNPPPYLSTIGQSNGPVILTISGSMQTFSSGTSESQSCVSAEPDAGDVNTDATFVTMTNSPSKTSTSLPTVTGSFINSQTIVMDNPDSSANGGDGYFSGGVFTDNNNDSNHYYFLGATSTADGNGDCQPMITSGNEGSTDPPYYLWSGGSANPGQECDTSTTYTKIAVTSLADSNTAGNAFFEWVNANTIEAVYYPSEVFTLTTDGSRVFTDATCGATINTRGQFNPKVEVDDAGWSDLGNTSQTCKSPQQYGGGQTDSKFIVAAENVNGIGGANQTSGSPSSPSIDCSVTVFNPLSWLLCPLAIGLENVAGGLDNAIDSELTVDTSNWGTYQTAFDYVRDISLALIVIGGLVAIISQAAGAEFLDAYTIRKSLPRILIVAIGISVAWPVMKEFVQLTNDLGNAIRSIIYLGAASGNGHEMKVYLGGGGTAVIGLIGAVGILSLGFVGILSFAATAALAASVGFLVLVLRQMIILLLVIFSPFAFVCYVLPHTQKVWKLWWDSFSKGLLMFPLITGLIAIGRVFAAVNSQSAGAINQVLSFVAYFAPYFLLPFTFRLAGGAIANIGGFVNDRHRGGFDRVKKFRANQSQKNIKAMQENRRFNPNARGALGRFNRFTNSALSNSLDPLAAGKVYGGRALRGAGINSGMGLSQQEHIDQTRFQHSQKLAERLNGAFNSEALQGLMQLKSYSMHDIHQKAHELRTKDGATANDILAASQLESSAAFLSKGLNTDPEMGRADIGAAAAMTRAAQGFGTTDEYAKYADERLGGPQNSLATSFLTQAQLSMRRAGRIDAKPGYGVSLHTDAQGKQHFVGTTIDRGDPGDPSKNIPPRYGDSPDMIEDKTQHQVRTILSTQQPEFQGAKALAVKDLSEGFARILSGSGEYISEDGTKANIKQEDQERIARMLGTASADYSSTSADTVRAYDELFNDPRVDPSIKALYENSKQRVPNPAAQGSAAASQQQQQPGQGQGGNNTPATGP